MASIRWSCLAAGLPPFDAARDGISIGEAAGFALLERAQAGTPADAVPCSASARATTPTTCPRRIPKGSAPGSRWSGR